MSITTATNLSVSNSLTVSNNTILGIDDNSTLIVNSPQTFNNSSVFNGNITHSTGTFNTSTDNFYMNGNLLINNNATFTTSLGKTTINSILSEIYGDLSILNSKPLFFTNSNYSAYLKIYHDGTNGYFDYTGTVYFRKDGSINTFSISNGQVTFYDTLNTTGITNTGSINSTGNIYLPIGKSLYIGQSNYIRIHHTGAGSFIDYTDGLNFRNSGTTSSLVINSSTNQATFHYNLNTTGITNSTNAITNNSTLSQVGAATFTNNITAPGIRSVGYSPFYAGSGNDFDTTAISAPKITNGIASGPSDGASYTSFNLAINSWQGVGFVYSNPAAPSICNLVIDNRTGNLTTKGAISGGSISCSSISNTGAITNGGTLTQNGNASFSGSANFSSITNNGLLVNTGGIELGPIGTTNFAYIDMKTYGNSTDYDVRIGASGMGTTTSGQGKLTINAIGGVVLDGGLNCASIICNGTIQGASISNTGSIYMDNASPIYLKSLTDTKNYIKYDSVIDGVEIGFLNGVSLKCTDNNSTIINATKTKATVNVDSCFLALLNGSKYCTYKGYTATNATYGTSVYIYDVYDGTQGSSSNVTMSIPENCFNIKLNTAFASSYPSNAVEGTKEIIMHKSYAGVWSYHTAFQFNSTTYHPTYSISSSVLTITFPTNTSLTGIIRWSNCVTIF